MSTQRTNLFIRCTLSTLFIVAIGVGVLGWTFDFSPVLRWIPSSPSSSPSTTTALKGTEHDISASRPSNATTTTTKMAQDKSITKQKHANNYDSSSSSSSCRRICDVPYRNTILYTSADKAGLYDRAFLIHTLGDMAGYLCATLEILKPYDLLSAKHNFNQSISTNMSWYDFYNLSVAGTNGTDYKTILVERDRDTFLKRQTILEKSTTTTAVLQPTTVMEVKTSREDSVLHDLVQVEGISWNKTGSGHSSFVWEISVSWWFARKYVVRVLDQRRQDPTWQEEDRFQMLPNFVGNMNDEPQDQPQSSRSSSNQKGCSYISMNAPDDMQLLLEDVWKKISSASESRTSTPRLTGILHIRRGDAIEDCETSLEQMKAYFDCTFDGISILTPLANNTTVTKTMENDDQQRGSSTNGTASRNPIQMTLLLASDERDAEYRQGVTQLLQTRGILVVDADEMIGEHLQQAVASGCMPPERLNNYYAFRLLDALKADLQKISLVLERRRKRSCRACDRDRVVHAIAKVTGVPFDEEENGKT